MYSVKGENGGVGKKKRKEEDGAYNNAVYECVGITRRPDTPPPGI